MPFLRRFTLATYLLVLLSLVGFTWAVENYSLMFLAVVATGLSWWMVETGRGRPAPHWLINLAVLALALFLCQKLVVEQVFQNSPNLLLWLGYFILGLILCKFFERKSNRDYGQIMILSLLLMMAGAILTPSLIFAIFLLLYLALGIYVSLIFHLVCETRRALPPPALSARALNGVGRRPGLDRDLRRISAGVGGFLFVFAALIFVLFPRTGVQGMLVHWKITALPATTGFSTKVVLGRHGRLHPSEAIVAEVQILKNGHNIGSAGYQPYFLGATLDVYDPADTEWRASNADLFRSFRVENNPVITLAPPGTYQPSSLITENFTLNQRQGDALFVIAPAVRISCPGAQWLTEGSDGSIRCHGPVQVPLHYVVQSATAYHPGLIGPRHPPVFPGALSTTNFPFNWVLSPPIPPRVAALAHQVAGSLLHIHRTSANAGRVDLALARRFSHYLSTHYPYSFVMTPVDSALDPTEDFLFNKKKTGGYCEYFASAMIMFCRSVGIPARMATGFHGGDYNPIGGYYVIRQKFAHAWVQAYIPGHGWMRFDPSPDSSLTGVETPSTWYSGIVNFSQWINLFWLQNIIAFNRHMRASLLHSLTSGASAMLHHLRAAAVQVKQLLMGLITGRSGQPGRILMLLLFIMLLPAAALAAWWMVRRRKRYPSLMAGILRGLDRQKRRQLARDLAFVDRLMRILGRRGLRRRADQTPLEYVQKVVAGEGGETSPWRSRAEELVRIFYDIRFGGRAVTPELRRQIKHALAGLS